MESPSVMDLRSMSSSVLKSKSRNDAVPPEIRQACIDELNRRKQRSGG